MQTRKIQLKQMISLDTYIEILYQNAIYKFKEHLEMLYIQAKSKVSEECVKEIDEKSIEDWLKHIQVQPWMMKADESRKIRKEIDLEELKQKENGEQKLNATTEA